MDDQRDPRVTGWNQETTDPKIIVAEVLKQVDEKKPKREFLSNTKIMIIAATAAIGSIGTCAVNEIKSWVRVPYATTEELTQIKIANEADHKAIRDTLGSITGEIKGIADDVRELAGKKRKGKR